MAVCIHHPSVTPLPFGSVELPRTLLSFVRSLKVAETGSYTCGRCMMSLLGMKSQLVGSKVGNLKQIKSTTVFPHLHKHRQFLLPFPHILHPSLSLPHLPPSPPSLTSLTSLPHLPPSLASLPPSPTTLCTWVRLSWSETIQISFLQFPLPLLPLQQ